MTLWSIWYVHLKAVYEAIFQGPWQTDSFINDCVHNLLVAEAPTQQPSTVAANPVDDREPWLPPPSGICKFNVDSAVARDDQRGASAVIVGTRKAFIWARRRLYFM